MMQRKQSESEVNPRKGRKGKHDDDYGTFKIGGENREIKKRTYDDYTNSLILNPTRETGNVQQPTVGVNGPSGRGYSKSKPTGYNIINHTQSDYHNPDNMMKQYKEPERNIHSNPINHNPRKEDYGRPYSGARNDIVPGSNIPRNDEYASPYGQQYPGTEKFSDVNNNVTHNYNYKSKEGGSDAYINHMNDYNPNTYNKEQVNDNYGLENYDKHYAEQKMPEITEEQYQKYYQEYLNGLKEQNDKEMFEKEKQSYPIDNNYQHELANEMEKMNIRGGDYNTGSNHAGNEYQYNKMSSMKGNNIYNVPQSENNYGSQGNEKQDTQKNYRDYLDSQVNINHNFRSKAKIRKRTVLRPLMIAKYLKRTNL
jgi:hypothetical protein